MFLNWTKWGKRIKQEVKKYEQEKFCHLPDLLLESWREFMEVSYMPAQLLHLINYSHTTIFVGDWILE